MSSKNTDQHSQEKGQQSSLSTPINIRLHESTLGDEEIQAVVDVMRSGMITSGEKVKEFENKFRPNAVMCNSGSSANLLAISALVAEGKLEPGDEVIVSALSWSTTIWPLVQNRLVPVIVDIDPETLNIKTDEIEACIGPKTKAIMVVHVYGNPCDMVEIGRISLEYDLCLIEDCCEALGAQLNGKLVGSWGDVSTYSFYFSHHISTGEGGLCNTDDFRLAERMRILRAHGWVRDMRKPEVFTQQYPDIDPKFLFVGDGYNLRCTEMQAAIGLVQLNKMWSYIKARRQSAVFLGSVFEKHSKYVNTQKENGESSWFGFSVIVNEDAPFTVKQFRDYLESNGIETRSIICGNIARQPGLMDKPHKVIGTLTNADHVMKNGFSIACHQALTLDDISYINSVVDAFMEGYK